MMCLQRLKEVDLALDFSPVIPIYVRYVHISFSTHFFLRHNNPLTGILLYLLAQKVTH